MLVFLGLAAFLAVSVFFAAAVFLAVSVFFAVSVFLAVSVFFAGALAFAAFSSEDCVLLLAHARVRARLFDQRSDFLCHIVSDPFELFCFFA